MTVTCICCERNGPILRFPSRFERRVGIVGFGLRMRKLLLDELLHLFGVFEFIRIGLLARFLILACTLRALDTQQYVLFLLNCKANLSESYQTIPH